MRILSPHQPIKLAIVGSRNFNDYNSLCLIVDTIRKEFVIEQIISGGAKGADNLAEKYAKEHNIQLKVFPAEWDKYGKSAGYRRNIDIIWNSDMVVAFWDGKSKGTKHSIDLAQKYHKELLIKEF